MQLSAAAAAARQALDGAARRLDDARLQQLRQQQALFLRQLADLGRLRRQHQECTSSSAPPAGAGLLEEEETVKHQAQEVEANLVQLFSVTDSLDPQEVKGLAKQLGISVDTIWRFIYKSQVEVEQVLESCVLLCPVPSKAMDGDAVVNSSSVPIQGSQLWAGSVHQDQELQTGKRRLSTEESSERDGLDGRAKRNCRRSSNLPQNPSEAGSIPAQPNANRDNEKILRLRDLQSRSGGLKDAAGAGSMLVVMREETSFVVRTALLDIIQQTHNDALLERLVGANLMFCKVMEKWIKEATQQHKTEFLRLLVSVLGRLPLKQDHIKNSRIQTLISRLASKHPDADLCKIARELVTRYQNLRQGLSPGCPSKGHAHGNVLERLQSGEAQQKGKAFFLSGDELKRPSKRKSLVKQRPLTTDEIVEKQQRHRYLNQARGMARSVSMDTPDPETQTCADNTLQMAATGCSHGRSKSAHEQDVQSPKKVQKLHPEPRNMASQEPKASTARLSTSGKIIRWMKEAPSDPGFYIAQQQLYLSARSSCLRQEKTLPENLYMEIVEMHASSNWLTPPMIKGVSSSLALGEDSTEKNTSTIQNEALEPSTQPKETPLEQPQEANSCARPLDMSQIPFAPCDQEEFEDQEKKLKEKGVRNPAYVPTTPQHAQNPVSPVQLNRPCLTPLQRNYHVPKMPNRQSQFRTGQLAGVPTNYEHVHPGHGSGVRPRNPTSRAIRRPRGQRELPRGAHSRWRGRRGSHWSKPNESAMGH